MGRFTRMFSRSGVDSSAEVAARWLAEESLWQCEWAAVMTSIR